jgi:hypothetical protein
VALVSQDRGRGVDLFEAQGACRDIVLVALRASIARSEGPPRAVLTIVVHVGIPCGCGVERS